jgi:hypothetical protein
VTILFLIKYRKSFFSYLQCYIWDLLRLVFMLPFPSVGAKEKTTQNQQLLTNNCLCEPRVIDAFPNKKHSEFMITVYRTDK